MLITSLNDEKPPFFDIDNSASANPSFGEELNSRSFIADIIELIIASSIKDIKIIGKYMPQLFLNSFYQGWLYEGKSRQVETLSHKQGRLNCPQLNSFFYAYKIAVIIMNSKYGPVILLIL